MTTIGNDLVVNGTISARQATQPGECVVLDESGTVPGSSGISWVRRPMAPLVAGSAYRIISPYGDGAFIYDDSSNVSANGVGILTGSDWIIGLNQDNRFKRDSRYVSTYIRSGDPDSSNTVFLWSPSEMKNPGISGTQAGENTAGVSYTSAGSSNTSGVRSSPFTSNGLKVCVETEFFVDSKSLTSGLYPFSGATVTTETVMATVEKMIVQKTVPGDVYLHIPFAICGYRRMNDGIMYVDVKSDGVDVEYLSHTVPSVTLLNATTMNNNKNSHILIGDEVQVRTTPFS